MTTYGGTPYQLNIGDGSTLDDIVLELNRVLRMLSDRLDRIEGYRGTPKLHNIMSTEYDLVVDNSKRGIVLKDGDKATSSYWRLTVDSTGGINRTNIGRTFVPEPDDDGTTHEQGEY